MIPGTGRMTTDTQDFLATQSGNAEFRPYLVISPENGRADGLFQI